MTDAPDVEEWSKLMSEIPYLNEPIDTPEEWLEISRLNEPIDTPDEYFNPNTTPQEITCQKCENAQHDFRKTPFYHYYVPRCFEEALYRDCPECIDDHLFCCRITETPYPVNGRIYIVLASHKLWKAMDYFLGFVPPEALRVFTGAPIEIFSKALHQLGTSHYGTLKWATFTSEEKKCVYEWFHQHPEKILFTDGDDGDDYEPSDTVGDPYFKLPDKKEARKRIVQLLQKFR